MNPTATAFLLVSFPYLTLIKRALIAVGNSAGASV
jgi:hypothetical protein